METNNFQLATVIVATISASAAAISALISARSSNTTLNLYRKEKTAKLVDQLNRILEIGIQYPYFESKTFTQKWNEHKDSEDERYQRYDIYCNLIFNFLQNVWIHFDNNKSSVEEFVDIKTWIRAHKQNWLNPVDENENIDGYKEDFRKFINSYIK